MPVDLLNTLLSARIERGARTRRERRLRQQEVESRVNSISIGKATGPRCPRSIAVMTMGNWISQRNLTSCYQLLILESIREPCMTSTLNYYFCRCRHRTVRCVSGHTGLRRVAGRDKAVRRLPLVALPKV